MKRILVLTLFTLALLVNASAQTKLTDEQWLPIFTALQSEDWNRGFGISDFGFGIFARIPGEGLARQCGSQGHLQV